jgi:hypothetical protein
MLHERLFSKTSIALSLRFGQKTTKTVGKQIIYPEVDLGYANDSFVCRNRIRTDAYTRFPNKYPKPTFDYIELP